MWTPYFRERRRKSALLHSSPRMNFNRIEDSNRCRVWCLTGYSAWKRKKIVFTNVFMKRKRFLNALFHRTEHIAFCINEENSQRFADISSVGNKIMSRSSELNNVEKFVSREVRENLIIGWLQNIESSLRYLSIAWFKSLYWIITRVPDRHTAVNMRTGFWPKKMI